MSILVPFPAQETVFLELQSLYPDVKFLPLDDPIMRKGPGSDHEHLDALRAYGLTYAEGEIIALVEDQEIMHSNWAAKMIEAHSGDFAVVGGAIENGYQDPLNWAAYFCDFLNYQNPIHAHQSSDASDANISYKRYVIRDIQSTWQEGYHELFVHQAIVSRGWKIGIEPEAIVFRMRIGMRLNRALKERFIWGKHYAALRQGTFPRWKALLYALFSAILPLLLIVRKTRIIFKKDRNVAIFLRVLPLTFLLLIFWSFGEMAGYLTGKS